MEELLKAREELAAAQTKLLPSPTPTVEAADIIDGGVSEETVQRIHAVTRTLVRSYHRVETTTSQRYIFPRLYARDEDKPANTLITIQYTRDSCNNKHYIVSSLSRAIHSLAAHIVITHPPLFYAWTRASLMARMSSVARAVRAISDAFDLNESASARHRWEKLAPAKFCAHAYGLAL